VTTEDQGRRPTVAASERSFGLSVGTVFCLIAAFLFWRGRPIRAEIFGALGGLLVLLGAVRPSLLRRPSAWWWRLAHILGYINTRVLLTVMFVIVFVPLGVVWRLMGRDPLARRRARFPGWSPYPSRYRDRQHYLRMY
jgi:saxitoxin biosynthesis operon SxtJ-like protein